MKRFQLCLTLLLVACGQLSHAGEGEGITGNLGPVYMTFDSDRNLDNSYGVNVGIGYRWASPWAVEFSYLQADTEADNRGGDVDVSHFRLDALYHWEEIANIEPYLAFGLGRADIDGPAFDDDQFLLNAGVGAKYWLMENTALRGDFRFFRTNEDSDVDNAFTISLHHNLSAKNPAKPEPAAPVDSDGDGVYDNEDACPGTPREASVDARGCAIDTDKDGVADYKDACPDTTQRGAKIDSRGCYEVLQETVTVKLNVLFDFDSAAARPEHKAEVKKVYDFMVAYPQTEVTIEGHTDSRGSEAYNQNLSQRRANTIANMLTSDFNVSASRVSAKGYGESRPVASNDTDAGRQENRRVVGVIEATVETIKQN